MKRPMKRLAALALAGLTFAAVAPAAPNVAHAQSRAAVPLGAGAQLINLPRGSSMAIDLPSDARDVIVPNPMVAEAMLHSPRRITIIGLQPGETDAVVLDGAGRTILSLRIRVDAGVSALQDTLNRIVPGGAVHAEAINDSIILTGQVLNPIDSQRAQQIASAFVATPEKVLNMLSVAGSDQVTLKVRVVEIQRTAIKQLGFNTSAVLGRLGDAQFLLGQAATFGVNGGLLGGFSGGGSIDTTKNYQLQVPCAAGLPADASCMGVIDGPNNRYGAENWDTAQPGTGPGSDGLNRGEATIKAFERAGLIRTLAEPNLTSVNGESATFLAGGEFPIVVGRDQDGTILTEYKPYGVSLAFRPIVMSGGLISMQITVEVSELTNSGALTIGAGTTTATSLSGLNVRRVQNTVELPSGGSMMIAGLLQETTRQNIDALPGLMNVPVLGSLFRSRDYLNGETELVVIVEPYIVRPTSPGRMQTPADGLRIANDAQTIFLGQLNQAYNASEPTAARSSWQGPVGYVIE